jgi:hypothetical protein
VDSALLFQIGPIDTQRIQDSTKKYALTKREAFVDVVGRLDNEIAEANCLKKGNTPF